MATTDPIFDGPLAGVVALPAAWRERAKRRREDAGADPVAENLDRLADALEAEISAARERARRLTPAEFGALPHVNVTPQTVRTWCRAGRVPGARHTAQGWEIPADAEVLAEAERQVA